MAPPHDTTTVTPSAAVITANDDSSGKRLNILSNEEAQAAVDAFCQFLRFETVSSIAAASGEYTKCAEWLQTQLEQLQVLNKVYFLPEAPADAPVVVAEWTGRNPTAPVLLLNSHYDVVPADLEAWNVPPFDGMIANDKIYGRGTQDMKCVCIQYIQALAKITKLYPEWQPERSIVLTFVPDEEVGGGGMAAFLESQTYRDLPGIALALDEGLASETDTFSVFYGERLPWWIEVQAHGPTGHGSRFVEHTAVEQLLELADKAMRFRQGQRDQLGLNNHVNCAHAVAAKQKKTLGDVTSLNITTLQAGVPTGNGTFAYNCIPPKASCSLDIRIAPHTPPDDIGSMLDMWCRECSTTQTTMQWKYLEEHNSAHKHATTSTDKTVNPWYGVVVDAMKQLNLDVSPQVFPAATDSRFLRALGIRALGFSPMRQCEILLHENDEYIPIDVFLEGITVYTNLIYALGSVMVERSDEKELLCN